MKMPKQSKRQPTGDYERGYCRPPKETRFQKGRSPNPGGRPRNGGETLDAMVHRALRRRITINVDERPVRVTMLEAAVIRQVNDLLTGTPAQRHRAFAWFVTLGYFNPKSEEMMFDRARAEEFVAELIKEAEASEALNDRRG